MYETKWFVWNPHGNVPSFEHPTEQNAKIEAERLARLNPGQKFLVLRSVGEVVKNDLIWKWFETPNSEIPF